MIDESLLESALKDLPSNCRVEISLLYSCAISLKRIADRLHNQQELNTMFHEMLQQPTNLYGESLVEGIQNAIERGQRGINTNG